MVARKREFVQIARLMEMLDRFRWATPVSVKESFVCRWLCQRHTEPGRRPRLPTAALKNSRRFAAQAVFQLVDDQPADVQ